MRRMLSFLYSCFTLDPISLIHAGGYIGIFALVFVESGLLVGLVLPGDSVLFAAGLLGASGAVSPTFTIFLIIVAAVLGDNVGYWFGKNVGTSLFKRPDSKIFKQEYVVRTQKFYATYGGRAVVFARFVPIVRTLAPILAGVGKMRYDTFLFYNALGAVLWGAGLVMLGYFLGSVIPNSEKYVLPLSLVIIVISFLPLFLNFFRGKKAI